VKEKNEDEDAIGTSIGSLRDIILWSRPVAAIEMVGKNHKVKEVEKYC